MFFWKTSRLVEDLRSGSLSERDFKNYYLATSIVTVISTCLLKLQPSQNALASAVEMVASVGITILGINAAFKANSGSAGSRFLEKSVAICFPLLIKAVVAAFFLGLCLAFWGGSNGIQLAQQEWANTTASLVIQAVFFWRLFIHVRNSNG